MLANYLKLFKRIVFKNQVARSARKYATGARLRFIHHRYDGILETLQKTAKQRKEVKVLFFVTQKQLWCVQSLYEALSQNSNFSPFVVAFPNGEDKVHSPSDTCEENYNFFARRNTKVIYGYDINRSIYHSITRLGPDVVFYDQPYPWLPRTLLFDAVSKKALICYVPYGYKISNSYEAHFNMELQNKSWRVFAESEWHKKQFERLGKLSGRNVVVSGYPKLDVYRDIYNCKDDIISKFCRSDEKKTRRQRIIWGPHWSIRDKFLGYSTFDRYFEDFLNYAKTHSEIDWIFKPHQRLKYHCVESGFMTLNEVESYYAEWHNLSNGFVYDEGDYFNIFKSSDALITDCGSFLAEYLPIHQLKR